jgi:hypothetical protein
MQPYSQSAVTDGAKVWAGTVVQSRTLKGESLAAMNYELAGGIVAFALTCRWS